MSNKLFKIMNYILFFILGTFMIIFFFYDYEIMIAMQNKPNLKNLFNDFGEFPTYFISVSFLNALLYYYFHKKRYLTSFASLIVAIMISYFSFNKFFELNFFLNAIFIALVIILEIYIFTRLEINQFMTLFHFLTISVLVVISANLSCQLTKTFWGRIRFRNLIDSNQFTRWLFPQGITGHKSFFSGHTVSASCSLVLFYLPYFYPKINKTIYSILIFFAFLWIIATAYSRIVVGAHYPSDVTFAFIITYGFILLFKRYIHKFTPKE